MAKFRLSIEKFELEIESDEPLQTGELAAAATEQVKGLLQTGVGAVNGEVPAIKHVENLADRVEPKVTTARAKRPRSKGAVGKVGTGSSEPLDWRHDPSKWGTPPQSWSASQKCLWLLYVLKNELSVSQVPGPVLAATFNKHFKTQGKVHPPNVTRDLGLAKSGKLKDRKGAERPLIGEDTTKSPTEWYLLDAGIEEARHLVEIAQGKHVAA